MFTVAINKPAVTVAFERAGYRLNEASGKFEKPGRPPIDPAVLEQAARDLPEQIAAVIASKLLNAERIEIRATRTAHGMSVEFAVLPLR